MADVTGRVLLADHYAGESRPTRLGRDDGDTSSLVRDNFSPWRAHPAELPPTTAGGTLRDRIVAWWQGDEPST